MRNSKAFSILLSFSIFYGILLIPWFFVWMASFFMFDSPDSVNNLSFMILFFLIQLFPLSIIGALIASWICYARTTFKWSYRLIAIPAIWAIIAGILFASIVTW